MSFSQDVVSTRSNYGFPGMTELNFYGGEHLLILL